MVAVGAREDPGGLRVAGTRAQGRRRRTGRTSSSVKRSASVGVSRSSISSSVKPIPSNRAASATWTSWSIVVSSRSSQPPASTRRLWVMMNASACSSLLDDHPRWMGTSHSPSSSMPMPSGIRSPSRIHLDQGGGAAVAGDEPVRAFVEDCGVSESVLVDAAMHRGQVVLLRVPVCRGRCRRAARTRCVEVRRGMREAPVTTETW